MSQGRYISLKRYRRQVTTLPRVGRCMRHIIPVARAGGGRPLHQVRLVHSPEGGARYRGVMRCGSVWACPECAAIIAQGRIEEIRAAMLAAERMKWGACWQTLTLPHDAPDTLRKSLRLVAEAWRRIRTGSGWRRLSARLEVTGTIRKVEVTHGENGWHPHLHLTYLTARPLSEGELEELEAYVYGAWSLLVTEAGFRAPRLALCPIAVLRLDSKSWAEYVGKALGWELAGQEKKTRSLAGRTPFELLAAAAEVVRAQPGNWRAINDARDVRLWREYERETKGKRSLSWSHHLKTTLGVMERDDQAALELGDCLLEQTEETVAVIQPREWRAVWAAPGRLECLLQLAALAAPLQDRQALVASYLDTWQAGLDALSGPQP